MAVDELIGRGINGQVGAAERIAQTDAEVLPGVIDEVLRPLIAAGADDVERDADKVDAHVGGQPANVRIGRDAAQGADGEGIATADRRQSHELCFERAVRFAGIERGAKARILFRGEAGRAGEEDADAAD